MTCDTCKHQKYATLSADECGGGNTYIYCGKGYWMDDPSLGYQTFDPWADCKAFEKQRYKDKDCCMFLEQSRYNDGKLPAHSTFTFFSMVALHISAKHTENNGNITIAVFKVKLKTSTTC